MLVEVDWAQLDPDFTDQRWAEDLCLYAYLHPTRNWILYIGKCDFSNVRERLYGRHKERLFRALKREYELDPNDIRTLHGRLIVPAGDHRTSQLLSAVESLLIQRWHPFGNIQSRRTRISRPGMWIRCRGEWPFRRSRFLDVG